MPRAGRITGPSARRSLQPSEQNRPRSAASFLFKIAEFLAVHYQVLHLRSLEIEMPHQPFSQGKARSTLRPLVEAGECRTWGLSRFSPRENGTVPFGSKPGIEFRGCNSQPATQDKPSRPPRQPPPAASPRTGKIAFLLTKKLSGESLQRGAASEVTFQTGRLETCLRSRPFEWKNRCYTFSILIWRFVMRLLAHFPADY